MAVEHIIEDKGSKIIIDRDDQINALSWCPEPTEQLICIGTVAGWLKIIDVKKNKVVTRLDICVYTIFQTDWNLKNGIVACSENGFM